MDTLKAPPHCHLHWCSPSSASRSWTRTVRALADVYDHLLDERDAQVAKTVTLDEARASPATSPASKIDCGFWFFDLLIGFSVITSV